MAAIKNQSFLISNPLEVVNNPPISPNFSNIWSSTQLQYLSTTAPSKPTTLTEQLTAANMSTSHHNVQEKSQVASGIVNRPAPGISYFTPLQDPPAGTALVAEGQKLPKLFQPLKLRGVVSEIKAVLK